MRSSSSALFGFALFAAVSAHAEEPLRLAVVASIDHAAVVEQLTAIPRYQVVALDSDALAAELRLASTGCAESVSCLATLDAYRTAELFVVVREAPLGEGAVLDVSLQTRDGTLLDRRSDWDSGATNESRRTRLAAFLEELLRARDLEWRRVLQPNARPSAQRRRL